MRHARRRRGPRRRRPPGRRRSPRRPARRRCLRRRPTWARPPRRRRRRGHGAGIGSWSRAATILARRAPGQPVPRRPGVRSGRADLRHHGDQRRQDHGIVPRVDPGERPPGSRPPDPGPRRPAPPPRRRRCRGRPRGPARGAGRRCRDGGPSGMERGRPSMRPAEVIGSWATTHPPGRTAAAICAPRRRGSTTCSSRNRQKARSTASGSDRSSPAWVMASTWLWAAAARGHLVVGERVAVDGVDPTVPSDHLGQRHRDVAPTGADVDTAPTRPEPEPVEGRGQRAAVDVVAQSLELAHGQCPAAHGTMTRHSTGPPRPRPAPGLGPPAADR